MEIQKMKNVADKIRSQYDCTSIFLFGSHAQGSSTPESDIDICVLLNKRNQRKLDISRQIRREIYPMLRQSIDILVYDTNEFRERSEFPLTFEAEIAETALEI